MNCFGLSFFVLALVTLYHGNALPAPSEQSGTNAKLAPLQSGTNAAINTKGNKASSRVHHAKKTTGNENFEETMKIVQTMHEEALTEFEAKEERKEFVRRAFEELVNMAGSLGDDSEMKVALYNHVKALYTLYLSEGDTSAKRALAKFESLLMRETANGNLDRSVKSEVFSIILQAITDARDEYAQEHQDQALTPEGSAA